LSRVSAEATETEDGDGRNKSSHDGRGNVYA
jgi:hypothetical protein